jgi:hypothetical protein
MPAESYPVGAERVRAGDLRRASVLALPIGAAACVAGVAAPNGSYFPTSWGWCTLAFLAAAAVALGRRAVLGRLERSFVLGLAAFAGFAALSLLWTETPPGTMREVQRSLVYVAGALALLLSTRADTVPRLLGGVLGGVTVVCSYALATRLFPGRLGGTPDELAQNRLAEPVGYWNGLGLLAVLGLLLALGFAARAARPSARAGAAATLPVLGATAYFTFSRGAWVALAIGLVVLMALERQRLRALASLAVLLPAAGGAALAASRSRTLTSADAGAMAVRDGRLMCVTLGVLAVASAIAAIALCHAQARVRLRPRTRRVLGTAVLVAAVAAVAFPGALIVPKLAAGFGAPPSDHADLNERVLDTSGNRRAEVWRIALNDVRAHPLLGSGAGSYEYVFYRERDTAALNVRDAHSLYLETLAELGALGLLLLVGALAVPFVAAVRLRRSPLVAPVGGAYAAFLAHAAWDWDWELPAVTLVGLAAGASLLVTARRETTRPLSGRARAGLAVALVVPAAFAGATLAGERANAQAARSLESGAWSQAASHARRARTLLPWSADPRRTLARASLAEGDFRGAVSELQAAIARDPRSAVLWLDLALVSEGATHRHALDRARALNPLNPELSS